MKKYLVLLFLVVPMLYGCAALLDGKVVTKDGKESSFKPLHNPYEPPRDPTGGY